MQHLVLNIDKDATAQQNTTYRTLERVEPKKLNEFQIWIKTATKWSNRITK